MHRCLKAAEILSVMMENLRGDENGTNSPTLSVLARTCRTFHEPALDTLWHTHHGLTTLIKCMPSDLWEEVKDDDPDPTHRILTFTRSMLPSDWIRFQHYSSRIRKLRFAVDNQFTLDVFIALSIHHPGPLLPRLHTLIWFTTRDYHPFVHMFLAPNIKRLELNFDDNTPTPVVVGFLDVVAYATPSIEHLETGSDGDTDFKTPPSELSAPSLSLPCLTTLHWDLPMRVHDIIHLAALPNLRDLELNIAASNDKTDLLPPLPDISFPSLRYLNLCARELQSCIDVLGYVRSCRLEKLSLRSDQAVKPDVLAEAFRNISDTSYTDSLTRLSVYASDEAPWISDKHMLDFSINANMLIPLLVFKNLKEVILNTTHGVKMNNDVLAQMAAAWRNLEWLELGAPLYPPAGVDKHVVTLKGLVPLVQNCHNLMSLRITLDVGASSRDGNWDTKNSYRNRKVKSVSFLNHTVRDPIYVAMILSHLFPNLEEIHLTNTKHPPWRAQPEAGDARGWALVREFLEAFADVRADERDWIVKEKKEKESEKGKIVPWTL